ncbi:hypothetical protein EMCRGX_G003869 [Ephydatia muelleri]|eukprot:Em0001g3660a
MLYLSVLLKGSDINRASRRTVLLKGSDIKRASRRTVLLIGGYTGAIQLPLRQLEGVGIGRVIELLLLHYHPKHGAIPVDLNGRCVVAEEIKDRDKMAEEVGKEFFDDSEGEEVEEAHTSSFITTSAPASASPTTSSSAAPTSASPTTSSSAANASHTTSSSAAPASASPTTSSSAAPANASPTISSSTAPASASPTPAPTSASPITMASSSTVPPQS